MEISLSPFSRGGNRRLSRPNNFSKLSGRSKMLKQLIWFKSPHSQLTSNSSEPSCYHNSYQNSSFGCSTTLLYFYCTNFMSPQWLKNVTFRNGLQVHYLVHSLPKVVSISRPLCFVLKMLWVVTRTCSTATGEEVATDQDSQGRVISAMVEEQLGHPGALELT